MNTAETPMPRAGTRLPFIGTISLGALSLIIANGGVLILYFVYDVTLFQLVMVFWCECLWVGIFSAVKLIFVSLVGKPFDSRWASVSTGGAVILSLLIIFFASSAFFSMLGMALMAILFANDSLVLSQPGDDMINHIGLVLGTSFLLLISHGLSFVVNFLILGEYRSAKVGQLVAMPFKRCLALLGAIVFSIGFVMLAPDLASTSVFAVVVIVLKVLWDLRLHLRERQTFDPSRVGPGTS